MRKNLGYFLFIAFLLAFASCGSGNDDEVLIGNWKREGEFGGRPPRGGASCFVIGDKVYLGLGYNKVDEVLNDMYVYDVQISTWSPVASLPGVGRSHAASFVIDGKGYICGGRTRNAEKYEGYTAEVWMFDPSGAAGTWTRVNDLPSARAEAVGATVLGKGYVGTGQDKDGVFMDFYEFDPASGWARIPDMFGSKRRGAFSFVMNNKLYVGGGSDNSDYVQGDFGCYDPAKGAWEQKRAIWNATDEKFDDNYGDIQRANGVAFVLNGKAYVTTGTTAGNSTWEYESVGDLWTKRTAFEAQNNRLDAVAYVVSKAGTEKVFVGTGSGTAGNVRYDDLWSFDPTVEKNDKDNGFN